MAKSSLIIPLLLLILQIPVVSAGADDPAALLPTPSCGEGWLADGKAAVFNRDTLSDRINGEAELFLPYGFETLAYGRYTRGDYSFDVDIYKTGSTLDAFGLYAGYRPDGSEPAGTGIDGAVTASQLFFYQDRYFVRLQSTGERETGKAPLAACAKMVSRLLPAREKAPGELELLALPEVDRKSVRYNAASLLSYDFFPKGLTADATVAGEPATAFVVLTGSPAEVAKVLEAYRAYLEASGAGLKPTGSSGIVAGVDPLYGNVLLAASGSHLFGLIRLKDVGAASATMERLRAREKK